MVGKAGGEEKYETIVLTQTPVGETKRRRRRPR